MTAPARSRSRSIRFEPNAVEWRRAARELLHERVPPDLISWEPTDHPQATLVGLNSVDSPAASTPNVPTRGELRVSRAFLSLVASVSCHRDPSRWALLYRVLWRLVHDEPHLLEVVTDPDAHALGTMDRAVRRAAHKMKAFVRFRQTVAAAGEEPVYVAWFEPPHLVVERTAPFFAERFASMRWSILTPDRCAHWDRAALRFTAGVSRSDAPTGDDLEALWRTYYSHIFNPARLNLDVMRGHMPQQYWGLLPEARVIADLARAAPQRVARMLAETRQAPESLPTELDGTPAVGDPPHDPGARVARDRADRVRVHAPAGLSDPAGGHVRLGVAGWTDPSILETGVFYPDAATTPEARLRYYASRFSLVEVDATYYSLPTRAVAERWVSRTPAQFVFDVKAHALMTGHGANLRQLPTWVVDALPARLKRADRVFPGMLPAEVVDRVWREFLAALDPLREAGKLGAVLLQFPPWFKATAASADALRRARERLGSTLGAVEFRHSSWLTGRVADRTLELLSELELAYVIVDAPQGMESSVPPTVGHTSPRLAVVRLHGRRADRWEKRNDVVSERYRYLYDDRQLRAWTLPIVDIAKWHQGVHVLFNNNHANYATTNALEMGGLLVEAGLSIR